MFRDFKWSPAEKKVARAAFDAYEREVSTIVAEVKKKVRNLSEPRAIWRIHDYLDQQRRETDEKTTTGIPCFRSCSYG